MSEYCIYLVLVLDLFWFRFSVLFCHLVLTLPIDVLSCLFILSKLPPVPNHPSLYICSLVLTAPCQFIDLIPLWFPFQFLFVTVSFSFICPSASPLSFCCYFFLLSVYGYCLKLLFSFNKAAYIVTTSLHLLLHKSRVCVRHLQSILTRMANFRLLLYWTIFV